MLRISLIALVLFISSCSTKVIPLAGNYPQTPIVVHSDKSFDQVWDRLVDVFAQKGLAIRIIDRSSGLITSSESRLPASYEDLRGKIIDPTAFVVIPSYRTGSTLQPATGLKYGAYATKEKRTIPNDVFGEWNVRVKSDGTGSTINVNINNLSYEYYSTNSKSYVKRRLEESKSTGVFERQLAELIK